MKLRNKLIPLATGLSSVAIIAPWATSCTSNTLSMTNLLDGYTPSIKRATWKNDNTATKDEMLEFYAVSVNKTPDILVQDWLWTDANAYLANKDNKYSNVIVANNGESITVDLGQEELYGYELKNLESNISNVKISKGVYEKDGTTYELPLLNFDSTIRFVEDGYRSEYYGLFLQSQTPRLEQQKYTLDYTYTLSFKNIPITINNKNANSFYYNIQQGWAYYDGMYPTDWRINVDIPYVDGNYDYQYIQAIEDAGYEWSVESGEKSSETYYDITDPNKTQNTTSANWTIKVDNVEDLQDSDNYYALYELATFNIYSHYLSQIILDEGE